MIFKPMTDEEYKQYVDFAVKNYADECVKAGNSDPENAYEKSKDDFARFLPEGRHTKDNYLMIIHDEENNMNLGQIWFQFTEKKKMVFLYDFIIFEEFRNKGYGGKALKVLNNEAKNLGAQSIRLHVFGHNQNAYHLYQKMGYVATNISMEKKLI